MASLIQSIQSLGSSLMAVPSACARVGKQATIAIAKGTWNAAASMTSATVNLLSAGKDAAVAWSVHNYAELFFRLKSVEAKLQGDISKGITVSQFNRNELAEKLEEFIDLYQPEVDVVQFLTQFCDELRNTSVVFDQAKIGELAHLEEILAPHFETHKAYIASKHTERDYLQSQPGITTAAPVKLSPQETLSGIESQFGLLKSNAISTVLGTVMLNITLGLWTVDHLGLQELENSLQALGIDWTTLDVVPPKSTTHLVNFLIEIANKAKVEGKTPGTFLTPEKVFKKLVHRIIDNSGRNAVIRKQAKLSFDAFAPLIARFVGNLIDNMKDTAIKFAQLPPEKQLEQITELLIDPLLAHLSPSAQGPTPQKDDLLRKALKAFSKACHSLFETFDELSQKFNTFSKVFTTLSEGFKTLSEKFIALSEKSPQTPEELLDHCIEVFLNQFIDPIYQPWTRTARTACLEKAASPNLLVKAFFLFLAGALSIAGKLVAPLQWILNETIHFFIKKTVVGLCPSLASATKNSLQIGKTHSWHSVKSSILTSLQQMRLNSLLPRTEDPSYQPAKEFPSAVTSKWEKMLDIMIDRLSTRIVSSTTVVNRGPVKNTYVIPGALSTINRMFAQEGFVSGILLSSLTSTNASGFAANSVAVPIAEKERIEKELEKELGILGKTIIQTVQDGIRTDKAYQNAANVFITTLKQDVQAFQKAVLCLAENPVTFESEVQKLHLSFVQKMKKLRETLSVDAPTQALLIPHLEEALRQAQIISVNPTEGLRKEVESLLDKLSTYLENPLDNHEKIESTLAEIKGLNPPFFDVNAFEADFNDTIEDWMCDILSKEKPANIEPLKQLIVSYKDRANQNARMEEQRVQVEAKLTELSTLLKMPLANKEAIKKLIAELKAINPSFVDIPAFEKDLVKALSDYKARLRGTKSGPRLEPLQTLVAVYKNKANRQASIKIKEASIKSSLASAQRFAKWVDQLKFVKVTTKPGVMDAGLGLVFSPYIGKSISRSAVQIFGRNLFEFIDDEDNLVDIAQKGMRAFIQKCPKQSQSQRRALIDAPKQLVVPSSKIRPISIARHLELVHDNWAVVPPLYQYSIRNY